MTNLIELTAAKISQMKKEGKYTISFLMVFGSFKNLELKSEETIAQMLEFLTKKGY